MLWCRNSTSTLHFNPHVQSLRTAFTTKPPRHDEGQCNETNDQHHRCHTNHPSHDTTGFLLHLWKACLPEKVTDVIPINCGETSWYFFKYLKWWWTHEFYGNHWKSMKLMEIRFSHVISSDNSPSGKQPTWKPSAARHCSSRLPGSKEGLPHGWVGIHHLAKLTMEHSHALNILNYLFKWI